MVLSENTSGFIVPPEIELYNDIELCHSSTNGFCDLYKCRRNGKIHILKALRKEYKDNPTYEHLLVKEFEIGYGLDHPNICKTISFEHIDPIGNAIVLEWVDGEDLGTLLASENAGNKTRLKIVCELCDALDYIHHKQIVHRDLKPDNILITHNGMNVKIIDFGLSDTDYHSILKSPAGTMSYASPEQIAGITLDCRSDIYSLGRILALVTPQYRRIIAKCCRKDREDRYATAAEVKEAVMAHQQFAERKFAMIIAVAAIALIVAVTYLAADKNNREHTDQKPVTTSVIDELSQTIINTQIDQTNQDAEFGRRLQQLNKSMYANTARYNRLSARRLNNRLATDSLTYLNFALPYAHSDNQRHAIHATVETFLKVTRDKSHLKSDQTEGI